MITDLGDKAKQAEDTGCTIGKNMSKALVAMGITGTEKSVNYHAVLSIITKDYLKKWEHDVAALIGGITLKHAFPSSL